MFCVMCATPLCAQTWSVSPISGSEINLARGTLGDGTFEYALLSTPSMAEKLAGNSIISLQQTTPLDPVVEGIVLEFANGDRLFASEIHIGTDQVTARIQNVSLPIPLAQLRGIIWDQKLIRDGWPLLSRKAGADDIALLSNRDQTSGQFAGASGTDIQFLVEERSLPIPVGKLAGIAFSPELISTPELPTDYQCIQTTAGWLTVINLAGSTDSQWAATTLFGETIQWRASEVSCIRFYNDQIHSLTKYEPSTVSLTPWFSRTWPVQVNRSVVGRPLSINGQNFPYGLGCHSKTDVTFTLDGMFDRLRMSVGLADSAGPRADVVVKVLIGDEIGYEQVLFIGEDKALHEMDLPISGANQIRLIVEFGDHGDIGDHVNWCDPLLIRDVED